MKPKVKICGIRSQESVQTAIDGGADFLGFNFVSTSKRYISPLRAKHIITSVSSSISCVGVFQNSSVEEILSIVNDLHLDYVQLHGNESPNFCEDLSEFTKIIKTISLPSDFDVKNTEKMMEKYQVAYFLLDRMDRGRGEMLDPQKAEELNKKFPLFYAGGLNPKNVFSLVKEASPYGVDVAGGIETDGKENMQKIRQFIKNAKRAL